MAKVEIGGSINLDASSVGNVRKQLKEATADLIRMQEQFGETSQEAVEAAKRVAGLRDQIESAKEMADLFDPGNKFKAIGNAVGFIAQGFTAVQGAMGLFGVESKELEKQLLRVQSAMALSQGLSGLGDAGKYLNGLVSLVKTKVIPAFNTLKGAIAATGFGLLLVALGTVVAYWEDIKGLISGVTSEQDKLNKSTQENLKAQQEKVKAIDGQTNQLKLQGKSEREILQLKIKQTDEAIKTAEVAIKNAEITRDAQIEASKRNNELLKNVVRFGVEGASAIYRVLAAPLDLLIITANKVAETLGFGKIAATTINEQITKMNQTASEWVARQIFDPEQTKIDGDNAIKEAKDTLSQLVESRAGYQLSIQNIDKQAADKRKADAAKELEEQKKKLEEQKKLQEDAQKILDDARRVKLTEQQRAEEDIIRKFEENKKALLAAGIKDFTAIEQQREIELAAIRKKYADEQAEKDKKAKEEKLAKEKEETERQKKIRENTLNAQRQFNEAILQAEASLQQKRFEIASAGLDLIGSLAGENEKIANVLFAVQKGLEIARIVTETARGIVSAKAGLALVPPFIGTLPNPAFIKAAALAAKQIVGLKLSAASSIATIAAASIRKFAGGGASVGGGGGNVISGGIVGAAPLQANLSPQTQLQLQNQQAINNLGNQSMRAYVLNSDIRNNNQRNAYLQRNARIG